MPNMRRYLTVNNNPLLLNHLFESFIGMLINAKNRIVKNFPFIKKQSESKWKHGHCPV